MTIRTWLLCLASVVSTSFTSFALANNTAREPKVDGRFVKLAQSLSYGRSGHTVEVLKDGRVLVAGGAWGDLGGENSAEILQLDDSRIRLTGQKMSSLRGSATHSKLSDDRILFTGGATDFELAISSSDIFDPKTNSFSNGPDMVMERSGHASVALPDGRVLVFGGTDGYRIHDSIEIYDPSRRIFNLATSKMAVPRAHHTAILVNENTIAIIGGETTTQDSEDDSPFLGSIELFDIPSMKFLAVDSKMNSPRIYHTATRLDNERVLIVGGLSGIGQSSNVVEILNVNDRSIVEAGFTLHGRSLHSTTLLKDGTFLIAGGVENGVPLANSERCRFVAPNDVNCLNGAKMSRARWGHTATPISAGRILFTGGLTNTPEEPGRSAGPIRGLEIFVP